MKNKRLINAGGNINNEKPEPAENSPYVSPTEKKRFWSRKNAIIAAALVVVIAIAAIYAIDPGILGDKGTVQNNGSAVTAQLRGLPVDNFSLSKVLHYKGVVDKWSTTDLKLFFGTKKHSIVVAKVNSVKDDANNHRQVAKVTVIQQIYGDIKSNNLQISQYNSDEYKYFDPGTTNLLREGGVYILPLEKHDNSDLWVNGDEEVLFEVDDKGKVFSHSGYLDFSSYDGQDAQTLVSKLQALASDNDFIESITPYSTAIQYALADVTINSKTESTSDRSINYSITINEILSQPTNSEVIKNKTSSMTQSDTFTVDPLEPGERYLLLIYKKDGTVYLGPNTMAKIKADGTVYNTNGIFKDYENKNVSDIKNDISNIIPLIEYIE